MIFLWFFKNTNVFIDQEGTNKIVESAKKFDFKNVIPNDSKDSFGIRVSDMICGFISKMMRALYDDTKNDPSVPYTTQHLLNSEWFHVNNYQFKLYKTIAKYIKKYIKPISSENKSQYKLIYDP